MGHFQVREKQAQAWASGFEPDFTNFKKGSSKVITATQVQQLNLARTSSLSILLFWSFNQLIIKIKIGSIILKRNG